MTLRTDLPDSSPSHCLDRDAYYIDNGATEDWADDDNLSAMIGAYERDGLPFTMQRFPAEEVDA